MSVPRRVPEVGELIDLPYGLGGEPMWWVTLVEWREGFVRVHVHHLLDLQVTGLLLLNLNAV